MEARLDEARSVIFELADVIGATSAELPTFGQSEDLARPHVEEHDGELALVVVERGQELERRQSSSYSAAATTASACRTRCASA